MGSQKIGHDRPHTHTYMGMVYFKQQWIAKTRPCSFPYASKKSASLSNEKLICMLYLNMSGFNTGHKLSAINETLEKRVLFDFFFFINYVTAIGLEKAMAPHSSTLAWKIPWTEEPGRLQSMGSLRVGQD